MSLAPTPLRVPEPLRDRVLGWPSTPVGKRASWLAAWVLALFVLDGILASLGASDWGDGARLVVGLSGALGMLGAIISFVLTIGALRKGDRSIVLLWPLLLGAFALMFVIGEFAFPH